MAAYLASFSSCPHVMQHDAKTWLCVIDPLSSGVQVNAASEWMRQGAEPDCLIDLVCHVDVVLMD